MAVKMSSCVLVVIAFVLCVIIMPCDSQSDEVLECTEKASEYVNTGWPGRRRQTRAAISRSSGLWVNNTIPYVFGKRFTESLKRKVKKAMSDWENVTCLRFVPRDNQTDYTIFTIGRGCCSNIGRQGGRQAVVLGYGCHSHRIILHELGHLVGFWHEQGRPDRDDYVEVQYKNIHPAEVHQFEKKSAKTVSSLGQPFDYKSIMLYGRNTFSKNSRETILPILTSFNIRERGEYYYNQHTVFGTSELSQSDILQTNLLYKCSYKYVNGKVVVGLQGNFTSPNFPKAYNKSQEFSWTVLAARFNKSQMLVLTVKEMNIGKEDPDGGCVSDWLEVREGKGPKSPYLAQLCGTKKNLVITVFGDGLFIRLHSTNSSKVPSKAKPTAAPHQPLHDWWRIYEVKPKKAVKPSIGFSMHYKTTDCKFIITKEKGILKSPGYPSPYRDNLDCVWQINAPNGFRIHITFEDFDFQRIDKENGCIDYLEIREGTKITSKFISLNCGRNFPRDVTTSSNKLRLFMHTTSRYTGRRGQGFKANYTMEDIDECEGGEDSCDQGCVNYPGGYTCGCLSAYKLVGEGPDVRCVDVDECQMNNGGCSHGCTNTKGSHFCTCPSGYYLDKDLKTCKDSDECMLSICSQKCVNSPGSYVCSCNYGYILDSTDKKTCKLAIPMCTGVLSANVGKFTSPPIPSWYREGYVDCEWSIRVRQRYTIGMYLKLLWPRDQKCQNYIKISVNEGGGMQTMKLCGHEDVQGMLHFRSHQLYIRYHTEAPYTKGFSLRYHMRPKKTHLCGGVLYGKEGTIQSPNYPGHYSGRSNCLWTIKTPRGRGALIWFVFFELETEKHCKYDYVDIETHMKGRRRAVGRFCGYKTPPLIHVKHGEIWMRFYSDATVQKRGFSAKYRLK